MTITTIHEEKRDASRALNRKTVRKGVGVLMRKARSRAKKRVEKDARHAEKMIIPKVVKNTIPMSLATRRVPTISTFLTSDSSRKKPQKRAARNRNPRPAK